MLDQRIQLTAGDKGEPVHILANLIHATQVLEDARPTTLVFFAGSCIEVKESPEFIWAAVDRALGQWGRTTGYGVLANGMVRADDVRCSLDDAKAVMERLPETVVGEKIVVVEITWPLEE